MPANDIPQLVAKLDALLEDMAGQQAMTDDSWRQPYAEIRAALRLVLDALPTRERTCGTCASRYDSGACMRDVQDPGGEEILGTRSTFNWRNRDEFGCLQHDARTLGRDTETPR